MDTKLDIPVYVNYGQKNFRKTYNLYWEFLKTVPFEKLRFGGNIRPSAGVIVSPRNNSGIPWCNLTIALLYAYKKIPFKIIFDDLCFLDPEWNNQLKAVEETVEHICAKLNTSYLRTSAQENLPLEDSDYKEIKRLADLNGIWNVRNIVPSERLNQYVDLSYAKLKANAKKIKKLYASNRFEHCVHQSLLNNNGGLHKWFGMKYGIRVSCIDISFGRGLVGIKDVPGYHYDLPDIIEKKMADFLDTEENRQIAKNEALKEYKLRKNGRDSRTYQRVSTRESDKSVAVDILIPLNILWDAASLGRNRFFPDPLSWLLETIDFILKNTTARVVVREHPGERRFAAYGTGKKLGEYLQNQFSNNPRFRFISCGENINTYLMIEKCKLVLPYTSTIGIEAGIMGKKVLVESNAYYKDQPFVIKANSKQDYFNKIKKFSDEYDRVPNKLIDNISYEKALLFYFLITRCSIVESSFGLDPADFEKWTIKGFDVLSRDENLMTAFDSIVSGRPFAYLNGKKVLANLREKANRIIELPLENKEEISANLNRIIRKINNNNYEQALQLISSLDNFHDVYLYPKAFVFCKLKRVDEAITILNELTKVKQTHKCTRFLKDELTNKDINSTNICKMRNLKSVI